MSMLVGTRSWTTIKETCLLSKLSVLHTEHEIPGQPEIAPKRAPRNRAKIKKKSQISGGIRCRPVLPPCVGKDAVYQRFKLAWDHAKKTEPLLSRLVASTGRCEPLPPIQNETWHASPPPASGGLQTGVPTEEVSVLLRDCIRLSLARCKNVQELEATLGSAKDVLAGGTKGKGDFARLLRRAHGMRESGISTSAWRNMLQRMVRQETDHKRFRLAAPPDCEEEDDSIPIRNSRRMSERRNGTSIPSSHGARMEPNYGQDGTIHACALPEDAKRERKWRTVFGRFAVGGRIQREDIPRSMEQCGYQNRMKTWIDEVYGAVAIVASIGIEDFIKFLHRYEAHQNTQIQKAFEAADEDGSGSIDVHELSNVINDLGWRPTNQLLKECIDEVDADGSGELSLLEFEKVLELLGSTQGFAKTERTRYANLFAKFDNDKTGLMSTSGLHAVVTWQGFSRTPQETRSVGEEVDLDGSGSIEFKEFLLFVRKIEEEESKKLQAVFEDADADGSGSLSIDELRGVLRNIGCAPHEEVVAEIAQEMEIPLDGSLNFKEVGEFLSIYRSREGMSSDDMIQIEEAVHRYAGDDGLFECHDIGKVLRWLGLQAPYSTQQSLVEKVNLDGSGYMGLDDVTKLVRMLREEEVKWLQRSFVQQDPSRTGFLTKDQAIAAWDWIGAERGYTLSNDFALEINRNPHDNIDLAGYVQAGMRTVRVKRKERKTDAINSAAEMGMMKNMFDEYDTDKSGNINHKELGVMIRGMFPIIDGELRAKLQTMMTEVDKNTYGSMDFQDFVLMIKQFLALQQEVKDAREASAIEKSCFSPPEVQEFRELFQITDEDHDEELTWQEIKKLLSKVCVLEGKQPQLLQKAFARARAQRQDCTAVNTEGREIVDFPEFLILMRLLLDWNFGNIKTGLVNRNQRYSDRTSSSTRFSEIIDLSC